MDYRTIPVIIPSLEPDERLPQLLAQMRRAGIENIVLVDDGSPESYRYFFEDAQRLYGCTVLRHAVNLGKGRALKTAFNYCLNTWPQAPGCVTADSDGQHSANDILRFMEALAAHPDSLLLGCRDFDAAGVPFNSQYGNKITRFMFRTLCGVAVSDTQTGLRAIPSAFMEKLLGVPGERFEFESNMLIETRDTCPILELPIETIYDSKENHTSHFHPVRDSVRIYTIFGKFLFASLSSSGVDLFLFWMFCKFLQLGLEPTVYITLATVMARVISSVYNYYVNHRLVFKSKAKHTQALIRYFFLAVFQVACSALLVTLFHTWLGGSETLIKLCVDVVLFFISFQIQREFVYKKRD